MVQQTTARQGRVGAVVRRGARIGYFLVAWVFVVFVLIQVFLAGLSVFVSPLNWPHHVEFGHLFGPLSLALILLALLGRLPRRAVALTSCSPRSIACNMSSSKYHQPSACQSSRRYIR